MRSYPLLQSVPIGITKVGLQTLILNHSRPGRCGLNPFRLAVLIQYIHKKCHYLINLPEFLQTLSDNIQLLFTCYQPPQESAGFYFSLPDRKPM